MRREKSTCFSGVVKLVQFYASFDPRCTCFTKRKARWFYFYRRFLCTDTPLKGFSDTYVNFEHVNWLYLLELTFISVKEKRVIPECIVKIHDMYLRSDFWIYKA
jgi:hypothetical protein